MRLPGRVGMFEIKYFVFLGSLGLTLNPSQVKSLNGEIQRNLSKDVFRVLQGLCVDFCIVLYGHYMVCWVLLGL